MRLNDVDLDFDIYDLEVARRYEAALGSLQNSASATELSSLAAAIETECRVVFDFFDVMFGAGTAANIFGESRNLNACLDYAEAVVAEVTRQKAQMEQRVRCYAPRAKRSGESLKTKVEVDKATVAE